MLPGPTMELAEDKRRIIVTHDGPVPRAYHMATDVVENHIAALGSLRAQMFPPVPVARPDETAVAMVDAPMQVRVSILSGSVILSLRDSRYGWADFIVSRERAAALAVDLIAAAESPAPEMVGRA